MERQSSNPKRNLPPPFPTYQTQDSAENASNSENIPSATVDKSAVLRERIREKKARCEKIFAEVESSPSAPYEMPDHIRQRRQGFVPGHSRSPSLSSTSSSDSSLDSGDEQERPKDDEYYRSVVRSYLEDEAMKYPPRPGRRREIPLDEDTEWFPDYQGNPIRCPCECMEVFIGRERIRWLFIAIYVYIFAWAFYLSGHSVKFAIEQLLSGKPVPANANITMTDPIEYTISTAITDASKPTLEIIDDQHGL